MTGRGRDWLRGVLALVLACASSSPTAQSPQVHRVAFVTTTSPPAEITGREPKNPCLRAFVHGFRELGYTDRALRLDLRSLEGRLERMDAVAADLVRLKTDVIVVAAPLLVGAVRKVSADVPLVMLAGGDILSRGLVHSLAKPGGNITGLSVDAGVEQQTKRLELIREIAPDVRRVAFLAREDIWKGPYGEHLAAAARSLGVTLAYIETKAENYGDAFPAIAREGAEAVIFSHGPVEYGNRRQIGEFAAKSGVPSSCAYAEAVVHGCLISYGVDLPDVCRRLADKVDRILKGANAGDLPIEQPTKFELVLNRRTAGAIGISIPRSVLLRADRVIE